MARLEKPMKVEAIHVLFHTTIIINKLLNSEYINNDLRKYPLGTCTSHDLKIYTLFTTMMPVQIYPHKELIELIPKCIPRCKMVLAMSSLVCSFRTSEFKVSVSVIVQHLDDTPRSTCLVTDKHKVFLSPGPPV